MIEAMNGAESVHAVDLPSGINGTSGAVMGVAVKATETVTFFRRKSGHLLLPGRLHCGRLRLADIGIPARVLDRIKPRTWMNAPELWAASFPVPRAEGHKYARGHAVVVSGGLASTGAARLAARGALRGGAGLVTIASPRDALAVNATANLAVMVRPVDGAAELTEFLSDPRRNTVVLGPGGGVGRPMRELVVAALAGRRAVVLDADALTSFVEEPQALFAAAKDRRQATMMTPHEGEFSRLFKDVAGELNRNLRGREPQPPRLGPLFYSRGRIPWWPRPTDGRRSQTTPRPGLPRPDRAMCSRVWQPPASLKVCQGSKRRRQRCGCMARRAPRQVLG